jgi:flagellar protein FliO/FliZ
MTGMAAPSPVSVSSLAQLTLSLVAIIGLIFVLGWVMKRLKLAGPRGRGDITVLDELALGPRERIVLVRVGDAQVLIGVGGVVGLSPLTSSITIKGLAPASPFAERLRDFMKRPGSPE